jgi:hypothetical protein
VINRLISGFHDCKWYCESLSVIKSGLTELPVWHAHELVHPRRPARDQGVLELLDLACFKINKPKPRRLSLIMCRLQSTNVSVTGIHSSAPSRFSDVPGVAAAGRPRLMIFLTVVPQSRPHPFGERGKAIAVPFLQRLTGERLTGSVALISENSDLVHQVGMLRPARTPLGHQSVVCETGISDARIAIGLLIRS